MEPFLSEMKILCAAVELGIECTYRAVMTSPVPLCEEHRVQVALLAVPEILAETLRAIQGSATLRHSPSEEAEVLAVAAVPVDARNYSAGAHGPVVYFITNGSRVKIGTSTNLQKRISSLALRGCDVALLLRGGPMLERALHNRFATERIDATEWFRLDGAVAEFISIKQDELAQILTDVDERRDAEQAVAAQHLTETAVEPDAPAVPKVLDDPVPVPRIVLTYPGTAVPIELKHLPLWELLGTRGTDGATAMELATYQVDGFISESNVRLRLRAWAAAGYVESIKDRRAERWFRADLSYVHAQPYLEA
jgi:hypothetical protein